MYIFNDPNQKLSQNQKLPGPRCSSLQEYILERVEQIFALLLVNKPIMRTPNIATMRDLGSKGGFCFAVNPIYGLGCS